MNDLQFFILEIYEKRKDFVSDIDIYACVYEDPKYYNIELRAISEEIINFRTKYLIDQIPTIQPLHQISKKGDAVYWTERIEREIKNKQEYIQQQLIKTSISNNKLTPIFAGLAAVFAVCSLVISWLDYSTNNDDTQKQQVEKMQKELQQQLKIIDSLKQNSKPFQGHLDSLTSNKTGVFKNNSTNKKE